MVTVIEKLNELEGLGIGTVVCYKHGVVSTESELMQIAIIVPDELSVGMKTLLERGFIEILKEVYRDDIVFEQEMLHIFPDFRYFVNFHVADYLRRFKTEVPAGKTLMAVTVPVKDERIVKKIAKMVEDVL
ncbi:hypothetical protein KY330_00150 [Candidatus Woesearchaeota archaeon]|nr:hypothetical protein [Candidatus Woesearchaeota archaeon]